MTTDWTAPIIIVGPGRSGTSLLAGMLNEHPEVFSIGETRFALQQLFDMTAVFQTPIVAAMVRQSRADWAAMATLEYRRHVVEYTSAREAPATRHLFTDFNMQEDVRKAALVGQFFGEITCPPAVRQSRWCFKEIWAGSGAFPYTWERYHRAFPNALFIQSLRHPLRYAGSYIAREDPATINENFEVSVLTQWVKMVRHAMELSSTGRYLQYRLEDLVEAPEKTFERICSFLELQPHPDCLAIMRGNYFSNDDKKPVEVHPRFLDETPGVRVLMDELGYE